MNHSHPLDKDDPMFQRVGSPQGRDVSHRTQSSPPSASSIAAPETRDSSALLSPVLSDQPSTPPNFTEAPKESSEQLSPPKHVVQRLTPLGKFSPRKRSDSADTSGPAASDDSDFFSVEEDIKEHLSRRDAFYDSVVERLAIHSREIFDHVSKKTKLHEERHARRQARQNRAIEAHKRHLFHKRRRASETINCIKMNMLSDSSASYVSPRDVDDRAEPPISRSALTTFLRELRDITPEILDFKNNVLIDNGTSFSDLRLRLGRISIFGRFVNTYMKISMSSAYELTLCVEIMKAVSCYFNFLKKEQASNTSEIIHHSSTFLARMFLSGIIFLVEENHHSHTGVVPGYLIRLANVYHDEVFGTLCRDFPGMKRRFLDNYYFEFLMKKLFESTLQLWTLFSAIVTTQNPQIFTESNQRFIREFETVYLNCFRVFKHIHLIRDICSFMEIIKKAQNNLQYMDSMAKLEDDPTVLAESNETRSAFNHTIKKNNQRLDKLRSELANVNDFKEILRLENTLYAEYQREVMSGSSLADDNPLTGSKDSTISNPSSSYDNSFKSVSSIVFPVTSSTLGIHDSVVPPTFSLLEWRKCVMKVYLEYLASIENEQPTFAFLKAGRKSRNSPGYMRQSKKARRNDHIISSTSENWQLGFPDFLSYLNSKFRPNVEELRHWLNLKTFTEGAVEAIEQISYLEYVDQMMVDVVLMVEKCMQTMKIVIQSDSGKVFLSLPKRTKDKDLIAILSDPIVSLSKLEHGDLSLRDYFSAVFAIFKVEVPDFLQKECDRLLQMSNHELINVDFIKSFIEFIRDSLIITVNQSMIDCLNVVGRNVLEFEELSTEYEENASSLDIRMPILFGRMLRQPFKREESDIDSAVYEYFNRLFIRMLCSSQFDELEIPEPAEVFCIQLKGIHNRIKSLTAVQSFSILLMTYLSQQSIVGTNILQGKQNCLVNFVALIRDLDSFMKRYFEQSNQNGSLGYFFKFEILKLIKQNSKDRLISLKKDGLDLKEIERIIEMNIDSDTIFDLIDQISKASFGRENAKSVRTVYNKLLEKILMSAANREKMNEKAFMRNFYNIPLIQDGIEKIIKDYYILYGCLYGINNEMLRGCYLEFGAQCSIESTND
ncbi:hypothetical protein FOA43_004556 [Brettanomyces nanus]|uniref:Uncharacterized protein n=1 Tax=Eeniella nana TaxID=13502 RepID=A0A875S6D0_EENNA|nr:uncharacterized protein FOA43_004556 [Brettanomyces nanus]QPG77151.1 hypothetical protein FOA43_004556 [Brettanomyces nanus]